MPSDSETHQPTAEAEVWVALEEAQKLYQQYLDLNKSLPPAFQWHSPKSWPHRPETSLSLVISTEQR